MPQFDFDQNEYRPLADVERRAGLRRLLKLKNEWYVRSDGKGHARLVSHTHDDDVELVITGNFSEVQLERLANELCAQLNKAELEAAEEFKDAEPYIRSTNFVDPDGANMQRKVLPPGLLDKAKPVQQEAMETEPQSDRQHDNPPTA